MCHHCVWPRVVQTPAEAGWFSCVWVHVDISDGVFANSRTWNTPETFLHSSLTLEIHFMVMNPEIIIESWLN